MTINITIETEDNNMGLIRAILADIIAESARKVDDEVETDERLDGDNCGFSWSAVIQVEDEETD